MVFEQEALDELAASIREHGVLQPILVRPLGPNTYQIVAGERRWRASRQAGLETIPALIEEIDDDTALEIAIIENLQREDLTPLDEAAMYDRMVHEHGYSIRKLADKLGKDKGYLENRLRLADAPPEIRELVSLRKDSLSHAYELMKVEDPKKRRRLAEQVARGELTLIKLRDKIEGRRDPAGRAGRRRPDAASTAVAVETEPSRRRRDATLWTADEAPPARRDLGRLAGQRQAEPGRGGRGARRRPRAARTSAASIGGDGPGEPGEVPDDRQAPARERDRDGPERRRRATEVRRDARLIAGRQLARPTAASQTAARRPTPTASSSQARSRRAAVAATADGRRPIATITARRRPPPATPSVGRRASRRASTAATPTTAPSSTASTSPRPLRPEPDRDRVDPGRGVALEVGAGVGDRQRGPGQRRRPARRIANDAGRSPVVPSQPKTGSSGIPTANGSHDQAVPLNAQVVAVADRQDDDGQGRPGRRARRDATGRARRPAAATTMPGRPRRHQARRDRLAGLRPRVIAARRRGR